MARSTASAWGLLVPLLCAGTAGAYVFQRSGGDPAHWTRDVVGFVIQQGGAPTIHDGSDLTAVRLAFQAWELPGSRLRFREQQDPLLRQRRDWQADDVHLVLWDTNNETGFFDASSGLVAVTPLEFDPQTGAILDADILIDARRAMSTKLDPGAYDLQAIVTHEVGHFLGLDHSAVEGSTLDPRATYGDTRPRSLEADDRAALLARYPAGAPAGTLRGLVRREGRPLRGAHVVAENERGEPAGAAFTDEQGRFAIEGLPGGSYAVYAQPLDGAISRAYFQAGSLPATPDTDFGTTFYGAAGRSSPARPARVYLALGATLELAPIEALPPTSLRITGISDELVTPGARSSLTLLGAGLLAADTILVPAATPGEVLVSGTRFRRGSASCELDVAPLANTGLRSVRVFRSATWDCAVLSGRLEVREPAPQISGLAPANAAPGDTLELRGAHFAAGARVFLADKVVAAVGAGEALRLVLPAIPDGRYDVLVENPDGQTAALRQALLVSGSPAPPPEPTPSGSADPGAGSSGGAAPAAAAPAPYSGGGGGGGCALRPGAGSGPAPWALGLLAVCLLGASGRRKRGSYT